MPFNNQRAPIYARDGMACSSTPLAAVVGRDILKAGGNAADAALAMAAVVNVTEPMMSGLGGDMFAMVWKDGKVHGLNASGHSALGSVPRFFAFSALLRQSERLRHSCIQLLRDPPRCHRRHAPRDSLPTKSCEDALS